MSIAATKIGILSIGDMGMGIAKLLSAHGFSVATSGKGRSNDTIERAKGANVEVLKSDVELTDACAVILSVVPPRDATATAERIIDALVGATSRVQEPLYFADLNAVAPSTSRTIAALIEKSRAPIRFVDGAIIGSPPSLKERLEAENGDAEWSRPSVPTSGPHKLSDIPDFGQKLFSTLNMRHISDDIGAASGLKMCFASTTKGFTSIAIQSFTTAHRLGVLDELRQELERVSPASLKTAEKGVVGMAPKAYRWVREMEEIALTFEEDGGFSQDTFRGAAKVYRAVAEESELGKEKIGKRKRGTTVEDMAAAMAEGMDKRKKKDV
ncbi:6-phosphogluconate dehydrogenase [Truncatella angustata]|uniref:6-phosphogluconate dehydrogenase n=1 Tax=Truncatella angustata TaxID=152316 RepID=A0A9P8UXW1_9PEZI|nr:6-phosphogluconate dehydrogenase [Truncatella angustata]KAH6660551.1 6-phosphogluconate dehydrogenase [Truncatella angustata]